MKTTRALTLATALCAASTTAGGASYTGAAYKASDLLSPCQEADNDARWGEAAETECEQYILGFVDALKEAGIAGKDVCPPPQNTADEVRWAYMRWVHEDYSKRTSIPAADALLATLKAAFPCKS